jgi:hypothetical protein
MPGGSEHDCPQHPELPMGGNVPLGYNVKDRKLVVNEPEASTGRVFLGRYAELRSVALLRAELDQQDIVSKRREGAPGCAIASPLRSPLPMANLQTTGPRTFVVLPILKRAIGL